MNKLFLKLTFLLQLNLLILQRLYILINLVCNNVTATVMFTTYNYFWNYNAQFTITVIWIMSYGMWGEL